MRYATYYYVGAPPPVTGAASGVITITGSAAGVVEGGPVYTSEAFVSNPMVTESGLLTPILVESFITTPLIVSSEVQS